MISCLTNIWTWINENIITFIGKNIASVLVVIGLICTYVFTKKQEIRNGKQRAYEKALEAFWVLYTKALSVDGYTDEEYYQIMSPIQSLEIWASKPIISKSYELTNAIRVLNNAYGERNEEFKKAQKVLNEFNLLLRKELGLKPVSELNPVFEDLKEQLNKPSY